MTLGSKVSWFMPAHRMIQNTKNLVNSDKHSLYNVNKTLQVFNAYLNTIENHSLSKPYMKRVCIQFCTYTIVLNI